MLWVPIILMIIKDVTTFKVTFGKEIARPPSQQPSRWNTAVMTRKASPCLNRDREAPRRKVLKRSVVTDSFSRLEMAVMREWSKARRSALRWSIARVGQVQARQLILIPICPTLLPHSVRLKLTQGWMKRHLQRAISTLNTSQRPVNGPTSTPGEGICWVINKAPWLGLSSPS